jgi:hypothetical protein
LTAQQRDQHRLALLFGRHDVESFLNEIDADQYQHWLDYLAVEPQGWHGLQHVIRRLSYFVAQVNSRKRLKEKDFELSLVPFDPARKARLDRARLEAMSIRRGG